MSLYSSIFNCCRDCIVLSLMIYTFTYIQIKNEVFSFKILYKKEKYCIIYILPGFTYTQWQKLIIAFGGHLL